MPKEKHQDKDADEEDDRHRISASSDDNGTKKKHKKKRKSKSKDKDCIRGTDADVDADAGDANKSMKEKKRRRKDKKRRKSQSLYDGEEDECDNGSKKPKKPKSKEKKRKRSKSSSSSSEVIFHSSDNDGTTMIANTSEKNAAAAAAAADHRHRYFPFEYQHIVAPMVGASELAFRLLCRKYGATLSYTPMMSSSQFVKEAKAKAKAAAGAEPNDDDDDDDGWRNTNPEASATTTVANAGICDFQTIPQDRPLVAHFSANDPDDFARAAKLVEPYCDAVDLNLGCPQRTAHLGHYGSYLLGDDDRGLVLDIVRAGSAAVSIPIFVKIRLLDSVDETIGLCHQLRDAGASLIAIHARYRASWERTGAGARDGPAMLDQVAQVKKSMPDFPIISNGNVITYDDVLSNRELTGADGIMSAEGILNNPALYLPRIGDADKDGDHEVALPTLSPLKYSTIPDKKKEKAIRKLQKKCREIEAIEKKMKDFGEGSINDDQRNKLRAKSKVETELNQLEIGFTRAAPCDPADSTLLSKTTTLKLSKLFEAANNKLVLAREYLSLVRLYPMKIRSVVFHTRRMCKDLLEKYQLMEECIASTTIDQLDDVLSKCERYTKHPETFHYDQEKAARGKEALARKRREEGKRKVYEGRMVRKAKREGLVDLEHYLRIGAEVPTVRTIRRMKVAPKEERLAVWKKDHSQHCMAYHLEDGGCKRDRACAFLHAEARDENKFVEDDEVAG